MTTSIFPTICGELFYVKSYLNDLEGAVNLSFQFFGMSPPRA